MLFKMLFCSVRGKNICLVGSTLLPPKLLLTQLLSDYHPLLLLLPPVLKVTQLALSTTEQLLQARHEMSPLEAAAAAVAVAAVACTSSIYRMLQVIIFYKKGGSGVTGLKTGFYSVRIILYIRQTDRVLCQSRH